MLQSLMKRMGGCSLAAFQGWKLLPLIRGAPPKRGIHRADKEHVGKVKKFNLSPGGRVQPGLLRSRWDPGVFLSPREVGRLGVSAQVQFKHRALISCSRRSLRSERCLCWAVPKPWLCAGEGEIPGGHQRSFSSADGVRPGLLRVPCVVSEMKNKPSPACKGWG